MTTGKVVRLRFQTVVQDSAQSAFSTHQFAIRSLRFLLKLKTPGNSQFFTANKSFIDTPVFDEGFSTPVKNIHSAKVEESWSNKVGYQVFPDRFKRSEKAQNKDYFLSWKDRPGNYTYYGGDLAGITESLEYLHSLKIDFIYLTPILYSRSSHRYDAVDYMTIDPILGTEEDFRETVEKAHGLGIKVVLDIPLNHCSTKFFAFEDVLAHQESSEYADWFEIDRFPVAVEDNPSYTCWSGYKEYPQFNFDNEAVKNYFLKVSEFWITNFGIDGWRLDSSSEIPYEFVREFNDFSRSLKPDLIIIGENWHNDPELIDYGANGITNYGLYWDVVIPFFEKKGSVIQFASDLMQHFYNNSLDHQKYCWNFLSNHDVPRFYSVVHDQSHYLLALSLLFCLPGTPVLYYGEEINMEGLQDPDNRRCMDWEKVSRDHPSTQWIQTLGQVKKSLGDLFSRGNLSIPLVNESHKVLILARGLGESKVFFVFNFSDEENQLDISQFSAEMSLQNMVDQSLVKESVLLPAISCSILCTR